MFKIENVTKRYDDEFALKGISLTINKGLNFIIGASGSGKSTLLKIISGMEPEFDGEVTYDDKNMKALSEYEKSYFYNNVFGFIWQEFNLLEDLTVWENILLPGYLKDETTEKEMNSLLKSLKLNKIAYQKVKFLSGGQKQRVAIARELIKKPQVIIADEPTSALDEKTAKEVMSILRMIAKNRTVIIVTHDTSLITNNDHVHELDKGELLSSSSDDFEKVTHLTLQNPYSLPFINIASITKTNIKRHFGRFIISVLTLMITSVLLLTTFGGTITSSGKDSFEKLLATYGETILDLTVVESFTSAGGVEGSENDQPKADVNQDIRGLADRYAKDSRVDFTVSTQAFEDISVTIDGKVQKIEKSGSSPVLKKLLSGKMPDGTENEVVVPVSFVKKAGFTNDNILNKEIEFTAAIFRWEGDNPIPMNVKLKAKVVGVADNTAFYEYEGKPTEYSVDDSFFFSKSALIEASKQATLKDVKGNFVIRAKSPADLISIKDELNKNGIVPIGQFELVEDIVRISDQTANQSGAANMIIALLAVVMVIAIFTITSIMRRKEYAIYKISGYGNRHLFRISFMEAISQAIVASILVIVTSPLLNSVTVSLLKFDITSAKTLMICSALIFASTLFAYFITILTASKTNVTRALKTGDQS